MTDTSPPSGQQPQAPTIDTTVPHSARVWNYWLGDSNRGLPAEVDMFGGVGRKP